MHCAHGSVLVVSQGLVAVKFDKSLRFTLADVEMFSDKYRHDPTGMK